MTRLLRKVLHAKEVTLAVSIIAILLVSGCTGRSDEEIFSTHEGKGYWCGMQGLGEYSIGYDCCLCKEGQMSNATNGVCCGGFWR